MPEYIERGVSIELLHYNADETCSAVVRDFEAIPAADVAPVVRREDGRRQVSLMEKSRLVHKD